MEEKDRMINLCIHLSLPPDLHQELACHYSPSLPIYFHYSPFVYFFSMMMIREFTCSCKKTHLSVYLCVRAPVCPHIRSPYMSLLAKWTFDDIEALHGRKGDVLFLVTLAGGVCAAIMASIYCPSQKLLSASKLEKFLDMCRYIFPTKRTPCVWLIRKSGTAGTCKTSRLLVPCHNRIWFWATLRSFMSHRTILISCHSSCPSGTLIYLFYWWKTLLHTDTSKDAKLDHSFCVCLDYQFGSLDKAGQTSELLFGL